MSDPWNDELLTAYLDGELTTAEREIVERRLAVCPEDRLLLADLQTIRASFRQFPRQSVSPGFSSRVLAALEQQPPSTAAVAAARGISWQRAAAMLTSAAVLLVAVLVASRWFTATNRDRSTTPDIARSPAVGPDRTLPDEHLVAQGAPADWPAMNERYVLVYDICVTPAGQRNGVVQKLLEKNQIAVDPGLKLAAGLEQRLLGLQTVAENAQAIETKAYTATDAAKMGGKSDSIELYYLVSQARRLNAFQLDLWAEKDVGRPAHVSSALMAMIVEPHEVRVLRDVDSQAALMFAKLDPATRQPSRAFRLLLSVRLTSVSIPGAAAFPIPTIGADTTDPLARPKAKSSPPLDLGTSRGVEQESAPESRPGTAIGRELEMAQVLLIVRNLADTAGQ